MTVKVPLEAAANALLTKHQIDETGLMVGVSHEALDELIAFAETFRSRALPGLGLETVAGESPEIILTDETLEADTFALIRLNGRVFVPEVVEAHELERMMPEEAWQDLVERSDRTSPAEYPDMALITSEELEYYMRASAVSDIDPIHAAEVEDDGFVTIVGGPVSDLDIGVTHYRFLPTPGGTINTSEDSPLAPLVVWPEVKTHAELVKQWRHEWNESTDRAPWGDAIAWRTAELIAERFDELAK